MAPFAPFENGPRLAVALSGGADSLALCLLLVEWTRHRGGQVIALTVNHGLRRNSAEEARRVASWMASRGVEHHILAWSEPKLGSRIQEAARRARYELLTKWCRENGVLHLCFGHHREDQAETVVMRLSRGSGEDGLAGMSNLVETSDLRILRPLLPVPRAQLRATLMAVDQPWIEDPSNLDPAYTRARTRLMMPELAKLGFLPVHWGGLAERMGRRRVFRERETARLLARGCVVHAQGYALIDRATFADAESDTSIRALARVVTTIGGREYAPAREKIRRVYRSVIAGGQTATLGQCRISPYRRQILVCREARHLPAPLPVDSLLRIIWDARFMIECGMNDGASRHDRSVWLAAVGQRGWNRLVSEDHALSDLAIPHPARIVLPALWDSMGIRAVPGIYSRPGADGADRAFRRFAFRPANPLSGYGFCLAPPD